MKRTLLIFSLLLITAAWLVSAQAPAAPSDQKTLAATVGVYVFPAQGQDAATQNREEAECYAWAVNNTGSDPFDLTKWAESQQLGAERAKAQVDDSGQGAGAKGALAGAAAGALIGEIASDDAGEGAVYGAVLGGVAARRQAKRQKNKAKEEIDAQNQAAQQYTYEQIEGFKKAFSLCLEAKKYLVKL